MDGTAKQSFFTQLFRMRGTVIITWRTLLFSGGSALVAFGLVMMATIDDENPYISWLLPELYHPFVVQTFAIILSFVIVARNNIAVGRYFDGFEHVHTMS